MTRREQIEAAKEKRAVRSLTPFDFLCGIDDYARMGGLRFKRDLEGPFVTEGSRLAIPPIASLRELAQAASAVEAREAQKRLPEDRWIAQLVAPGSSLGGARPKATVQSEEGELWIAKFPSRADTRDVSAWEHFALTLAASAGIRTETTKLIDAGGPFKALLARRFDREGGRRIHFMSSMTMLGLSDGDGAATGRGYPDIAEAIIERCADVDENLKELFRRVCFSICIGNADDHFRNHGFLLSPKGWTLSPAYDINPTLERRQSLLISSETDASDLEALLRASDEYFIEKAAAEAIVDEVLAAMQGWQALARRLGLPARDIDMFESRFITAA